jgi:hypothetical protein
MFVLMMRKQWFDPFLDLFSLLSWIPASVFMCAGFLIQEAQELASDCLHQLAETEEPPEWMPLSTRGPLSTLVYYVKFLSHSCYSPMFWHFGIVQGSQIKAATLAGQGTRTLMPSVLVLDFSILAPGSYLQTSAFSPLVRIQFVLQFRCLHPCVHWWVHTDSHGGHSLRQWMDEFGAYK